MNDIIRRHQRRGSVRCRARPGRSRITSLANDRRIELLSKRNTKLTAPEVTAEINTDQERHISVSTIKR